MWFGGACTPLDTVRGPDLGRPGSSPRPLASSWPPLASSSRPAGQQFPTDRAAVPDRPGSSFRPAGQQFPAPETSDDHAERRALDDVQFIPRARPEPEHRSLPTLNG